MGFCRGMLGVMVLATAAWSRWAGADVWDPLDNDNSTTNELQHGSDQFHDLASQPGPASDEDWYRIVIHGVASYEIVVEGFSPDVAPLSLELVDSAGTVATGVGLLNRTLLYENPAPGPFDFSKYVRVRSGGCTTACGPNTPYRIRASETTGSIPRFNNSATQVTVVILRNNTGCTACGSGTLSFFSAAGSLLAQVPFTTTSFGTFVLNSATVPALQGQSGSISVTGVFPYGRISGKAVALEPATGFTFDTPMVFLPH